jgi:hypothetical protein
VIRRCDGTDPNLTRDVREGEQQRGPWPGTVPCDCGRVFDDVDRLTIYPHSLVGGSPFPGVPR